MNYKNQLLSMPLRHLILIIAIGFTSCNKEIDWELLHGGKGGSKFNEGISTLLLWNNAATVAAAGLPPNFESRAYAMVNIAMYDALNSIKPKSKAYAYFSRQPANASIDAALATAAHDAMVAALPQKISYADSLLNASLSFIPDGDAKQKGIEAGKAAANAIVTKRTGDGSENAEIVPFIQGTLPGEYRSTPPFDGPPFNGLVGEPGWGNVKPFGLVSSSQFRPVAPYTINSDDYTKDYNDVKTLGASVGSTRTADQSQIGLFWIESAPLSFNRIARNLVISKNIDTWKAARLLTLVAIAEADANIGCFEAKYFYHYWRPITAIRLGDSDNNPNTTGDAAWDVFAPPTPPVPDYPSNHSVNGAAGAEILKDFFGTDNISFDETSSSLPNITRHYNSFSGAALDNALSRVYVGYHFRNACMKGLEQGKKIGKFIFDHQLKEE